MKELSIEQKAKRYDNLLVKLQEAKVDNSVCDERYCCVIDDIVPELKESEDEKTRKELIDFVKSRLAGFPQCEKYIAWLEKRSSCQNDVNHNIAENDKKEFIGDGFIRCCADFQDFKEGETYWLEYLGDDNYNVRSDNLLGKTYHITPCQLYTVFKKLTWLEKQGEQKDFASIKPKFNEGDWVVFKNKHQSIYQVEKIEDGYYLLRHTRGGTFRVCVLHDESLRLWTIEDARDGDVLVFKNNIGGIIICKSPTDYDTESYCRLVGDNLINKEESGWDSTLLVPATKEQRDTLFARMEKEGYKWNADKKELIKL